MANPFNLIMISAEMEHTGTITTRRFDGHPQCMVFPFEYQLGTKYSHNVMIPFIHPVRYGYAAFPEGTSYERAYDLIWNEELKCRLRSPDRSKFRDVPLDMSEADLKREYLGYCSNLHETNSFRAIVIESLLRATFDVWRDYVKPAAPKWHVAYNPGMVADTDKLMADFPFAHVIHVVRNPFSAYADYLTRPYPQQTLEEYCLAYNVAHALAANYAVKYPSFHVVRAEDLMSDAKAALTPILSKIGMDWDDALLKPSFNGKDLSAHLPPFGAVRQPTAEYNKAQALSLTPSARSAISNECRLLIDHFSYSRFADDI